MRTLLTATAVASLVAVGACAHRNTIPVGTAPEFYRPTVGLRDVKLGGVGLTGGSLEVVLNIYNPNEYQLQSPRVVYRVLVDDHRLAKGIYDSEVSIPSGDSVQVRVPASISYSDLGQAGRSLIGMGAVNYRVIGDIIVDTPSGRLKAPYDRAGTFSSLRPQLPR